MLARRSARFGPATPVSMAALAVVFTIATIATIATPAAAARASSAALPLCPSHDPTRYHDLVDDRRGCHRDHEHKDDPHRLDRLFGNPGAWFEGGELSYPWQTWKGAGEGWPAPPDDAVYETAAKHGGYGWGVRRGLACKPAADAEGCLTDVRIQVHALPTVHDATARFHSYSLEARGCVAGRCGTIREGGWIDYGRLRIDEGQPGQIDHVPLPGDPATQDSVNPRRIHKSPGNNQRDATWYTQGTDWNRHLTWLGLRFESAAPVDPADPVRELDYCTQEGRPRGACPWNGSWLEVHLVPIRIPAELDARDGRKDGVVSFRGFTDRYGNLVRGCRRPALDCVPLRIEQMPVGYYQYRDDEQGIVARDHDVSPGMRRYLRTGELGPASHWWIRYPEPGHPHGS